MKRAIVLLVICALAALMIGPAPAQASSAAVTFSGPEKVKVGQTYTYTYKIEVKSVTAARVVPITAGGGFEAQSGGEGLMYDTIPNNTSGSSEQGTIVVKVKSSAKVGEKCTLSTTGDYAVLDEKYNETEHTFSGSLIAVVVSGSGAAKETESPTSSPTPSPTPSPTSSPTPSSTPSPSPTPGSSLSGTMGTEASVGPTPLSSEIQTDESMPLATAETAVNTSAAGTSGSGGVSAVAIVVGALAVVLIALIIVLIVKRQKHGNRGAYRRYEPSATADSRTMRRASQRRGRKRPRH